jgi:hypothetical protein
MIVNHDETEQGHTASLTDTGRDSTLAWTWTGGQLPLRSTYHTQIHLEGLNRADSFLLSPVKWHRS